MTHHCWKIVMLTALTLSCLIGGQRQFAEAASCKVLVVNMFEEAFYRTVEINTGIEEVLDGQCELNYFYLDAVSNPGGVEKRARSAYEQYQRVQPDGVIAVGDVTQQHFVLPYLKDKVETPVMFAHVLASPEEFGYPASNVSGIVVRLLIHDTLVFAQQLSPSIKTVGLLVGDEPTTYGFISQINEEKEGYPVTVLDPVIVRTVDEAVAQAKVLKEQCDALYIGPIVSVFQTEELSKATEKALVTALTQAFDKPTLTNATQHVETGMLCGVKDFGEEQGRVAAGMLLKAMQGTPLSDLPVTHNQYGERLLNVATLKTLGIRPSRSALAGVELIR